MFGARTPSPTRFSSATTPAWLSVSLLLGCGPTDDGTGNDTDALGTATGSPTAGAPATGGTPPVNGVTAGGGAGANDGVPPNTGGAGQAGGAVGGANTVPPGGGTGNIPVGGTNPIDDPMTNVCMQNDPLPAAGVPNCIEYPGDERCEVTEAYCAGCATDERCKCVIEDCAPPGVVEGPLACSEQTNRTHDGGSTRYWINQASSDRDKSGGYEALGCGLPVMSKGNDSGSAATQDKVLGAPGGGTLFGALNSSDFGENAAFCGACVRVNDRVTIQIVDECPNRPGAQGNPVCTSGHIDLSVAAANQVGGDNPRISWKIVPCENSAPEYVWLPNSKEYWGALAIAGLTYPARKVELHDGTKWIEGKRKAYWGAWVFGMDESIPGSSGTIPPGPWSVRITDINGQVMIDRFGSASDGYANPVSNGQVQPHPSEGMVQLPMCGT